MALALWPLSPFLLARAAFLLARRAVVLVAVQGRAHDRACTVARPP